MITGDGRSDCLLAGRRPFAHPQRDWPSPVGFLRARGARRTQVGVAFEGRRPEGVFTACARADREIEVSVTSSSRPRGRVVRLPLRCLPPARALVQCRAQRRLVLCRRAPGSSVLALTMQIDVPGISGSGAAERRDVRSGRAGGTLVPWLRPRGVSLRARPSDLTSQPSGTSRRPNFVLATCQPDMAA